MTKPMEHQIKQVTFIAADPGKVHDAITSADSWDAFFTTGMELDPVPGGKCTFRWKDWGPQFYTASVEGKVLECERPSLFVFQWGSKQPSRVQFRLTSKYGGTVVELTESGYQDNPEGRDMILECASGWGEAITLLKFYLEHGLVYTPPNKENRDQ